MEIDRSYSDASGLTLKPGEFRQISELAYERFGLDLKRGKEALVAARLGKKLRQLGFQSFSEYYRHVVSDATGEALVELIDSLTTNHTSFLRERAHFEVLARAASEEFREDSNAGDLERGLLERRGALFDCHVPGRGAGSSGRDGRFRILATDISTRVLAVAQRAVYPAERFREVARGLAARLSFARGRRVPGVLQDQAGNCANGGIQAAQFDRAISRTSGLFHVIFCRNVMMYFDKPTQQDIVQRLSRAPRTGWISLCRPFRVAHRRGA